MNAENKLDTYSTQTLLSLMHQHDASVPLAIEKILPQLEKAIELMIKAYTQGGRFVYLGAGASGLIAFLDASEIPDTFGIDDDRIVCVLSTSEEEDSLSLAKEKLSKLQLQKHDVLIALSASGNTPFVLAGLEYAQSIGTPSITIGAPSGAMHAQSTFALAPDLGDEFLQGSSRLKGGTATKLILNMLSTISMIRLGKVYGEWMIDVKPLNEKLQRRQVDLIVKLTGTTEKKAKESLKQSNQNLKLAVLGILDIEAHEAQALLKKHNNFLRPILEAHQNNL